ncbi:MAG: winged helix DNA-binding protein [Boseongicola sp.]|nr:winged helix DNA-binding protein [Boseongicola sp.]
MAKNKLGPVVSSAHLAESSFPEVSEFEFGLIVAGNGFYRWMTRAMAAAGFPELSAFDVLVLHTVRHRDREKTLADICLVLNVEDTHTVNYAVKKLKSAGLVSDGRRGKEKSVKATELGREACSKYAEGREQLLLDAAHTAGLPADKASELAGILRLMSGLYDQAARAATVV